MGEDTRWHAEAPPAPRLGKCEAHLRGEGVRDAMQSERRLAREARLLLRPEPYHREILVVSRGAVHEPVHAASHADHTYSTGAAQSCCASSPDALGARKKATLGAGLTLLTAASGLSYRRPMAWSTEVKKGASSAWSRNQ